MRYTERRDCATCGHDITLHAWVDGKPGPGPCKGYGPRDQPSDCGCQDYTRPRKGSRRVRPCGVKPNGIEWCVCQHARNVHKAGQGACAADGCECGACRVNHNHKPGPLSRKAEYEDR